MSTDNEPDVWDGAEPFVAVGEVRLCNGTMVAGGHVVHEAGRCPMHGGGEKRPRTFTPATIPSDVLSVRTDAGIVWQRMPDGVDLWQRPDLPASSRGWVTTTQLLTGGAVTEVCGDA